MKLRNGKKTEWLLARRRERGELEEWDGPFKSLAAARKQRREVYQDSPDFIILRVEYTREELVP